MHSIKHIALIPDGNRRWAKEHGLPTLEGHRRGFDAVMKIAKHLRKLKVQTFTVWAFSTENWSRSKEEVGYLMGIYEQWIDLNLKTAIKDKARIVHLGRKDRIPERLRKKLEVAEKKTQEFDSFYLCIALDYGGKDEVARAVQKLTGGSVDEGSIEKHLDTAVLPYPNPDMIIRTSGEQRTSGFMIWQSAYAEYFFVPQYLPDFTVKDLDACIKEYGERQRRFGR